MPEDLTPDQEEERARRPRVVDKRVSARREATGSHEAPASAPAADLHAEPAGPAATTESTTSEPDTAPSTATDHAAAGVAGLEADPLGRPPVGAPVWTPEQEAEIQAMAQEIAETPSLEWVVNAAATLANVAGTKLELGQEADAAIAIDALSGILSATSGRLAGAETPLRQVLAQLQFGFAQRAAPPPTP